MIHYWYLFPLNYNITQEVPRWWCRVSSRVPCQGLNMMASWLLATPPPPSTWRHVPESGHSVTSILHHDITMVPGVRRLAPRVPTGAGTPPTTRSLCSAACSAQSQVSPWDMLHSVRTPLVRVQSPRPARGDSGGPRLCAQGHQAAAEEIQTHCHQCEGILWSIYSIP